MLTIPPTEFRKRNVPLKKRPAGPTPPPAALTLVAASYFAPPSPKVRIQFDRAIDFSALDGTQITVGVAAESKLYQAAGAITVIDPATVEIGLVVFLFFAPAGVHLAATADTGIVAVNDGGTWAGVFNLALPFS